MKRFVSAALALVMIIGCITLAGCSKKKSEVYNLVLITDGAPVNDGEHNESAWNGIKAYGEEKNMTYR